MKIAYKILVGKHLQHIGVNLVIRGPFEKFVDWRQCANVMQREAITILPSCNDWGNVVVA
jgi:hypothetical protein